MSAHLTRTVLADDGVVYEQGADATKKLRDLIPNEHWSDSGSSSSSGDPGEPPDLSKLKVDDLRDLASDRGLDTSGKKDELLARLAEDEAAKAGDPPTMDDLEVDQLREMADARGLDSSGEKDELLARLKG